MLSCQSFGRAESACKLVQILLASLLCFLKSSRQSNARSVGRARKRETNAQRRSVAPLFACGGVRRFFFAKPDGACASALSAAKHVFICAYCAKEKSGRWFKIAFAQRGIHFALAKSPPPLCVTKGNPPLVRFPRFALAKLPLCGAF